MLTFGEAQSDTLASCSRNTDQAAMRSTKTIHVVSCHAEGEVETPYGGYSFMLVDAAAMGVEFRPEEARKLAERGVRITNVLNAGHQFYHPDNPEWTHVSFCLFAGPVVGEEALEQAVD
ncbi:putative proline racemase protein [Fulvimarina pelagi HTCC2506]|uniref:Putative proline racemase protein n=2 Tax=Fulvimarina pelagi TaxID=217511 RepID=Q0G419_9HYPH|nr:putative proline racemase protein [Fulvimarina pelagi HTCC2506]